MKGGVIMYECDTQNIKAAIGEVISEDRRIEFNSTDLFSFLVVGQDGDTKEKRQTCYTKFINPTSLLRIW